MVEAKKARAVGFNHVALEVGDIEEALAFYGRLFDFKLRGKSATSAEKRWLQLVRKLLARVTIR
jgi:lactoylglutathione lyase